MLALCQHKETLKHLAFQYMPLETPGKVYRRRGLAIDRLDRSEFLHVSSSRFSRRVKVENQELIDAY